MFFHLLLLCTSFVQFPATPWRSVFLFARQFSILPLVVSCSCKICSTQHNFNIASLSTKSFFVFTTRLFVCNFLLHSTSIFALLFGLLLIYLQLLRHIACWKSACLGIMEDNSTSILLKYNF